MLNKHDIDLGYGSNSSHFKNEDESQEDLVKQSLMEERWKDIEKFLSTASERGFVLRHIFQNPPKNHAILEFVCSKLQADIDTIRPFVLDGACDKQTFSWFLDFLKRQPGGGPAEIYTHSYDRHMTGSFLKTCQAYETKHQLSKRDKKTIDLMRELASSDNFINYFDIIDKTFPQFKQIAFNHPLSCLDLISHGRRPFSEVLIDENFIKLFEKADWVDVFKEALKQPLTYVKNDRLFLDNLSLCLRNDLIKKAYDTHTSNFLVSNKERLDTIRSFWAGNLAIDEIEQLVLGLGKEGMSAEEEMVFEFLPSNHCSNFSFLANFLDHEKPLSAEHAAHPDNNIEWEKLAHFLRVEIPEFSHPTVADFLLESSKCARRVFLNGGPLRDVLLSPEKTHIMRHMFETSTLDEFKALARVPGVPEWADEFGDIAPLFYLKTSSTRGYNFIKWMSVEAPEWVENPRVIAALKQNGMTNETIAKFQKQKILGGLKKNDDLRKMLGRKKKTAKRAL